ncbi:MAG: ATP-binding protein [Actinomycetota bacterium]|nr:ATP-binding protein [Actinomycetota bacterium]
MSWDAVDALGCDNRAPGRARSFCIGQLRKALRGGPELESLLEDTAIVASELVTNAVNAGCADVRVSMSIHPAHLRLTVRDDAPGTPSQHHAQPQDVHGRGIAIMAALARAWGVETAPPHKQTWAELAFAPSLTAHWPLSGEMGELTSPRPR